MGEFRRILAELLNDGLINGDATLNGANGEMVTQRSCLMVRMVKWCNGENAAVDDIHLQ